MVLQVIGVGFGRTGTNSLKQALETLGFGPCHHMFEIRENPEQIPYWSAAARGEIPDWDDVFVNYQSAVDWPSVRYWREITSHYPEAKIVLSVRDRENWFESVHKTIYPAMCERENIGPGDRRDMLDMAYETVVEQTFGGRMDDQNHAISIFDAHIKEVQGSFDAERLLTYEISEGWQPLCEFLGVPIPDIPMHRTNTTKEFNERKPGSAAASKT